MAALAGPAGRERARRVRDALESEGLGPSAWRERDCVTLLRAVVRALSGREPSLALPAWTDGLGEREAILRAPREHGSLRDGWAAVLDAEPLLRRVPRGCLPRPGMIALAAVVLGPGGERLAGASPGVIGPGCECWVRTPRGIERAHPVTDLWEVR